MGWGDAGLAISLGVSGFPTMMARMSGNPALIERFGPGTLGCWAITEPGHGSDLINFDGSISHPGGHDERPNCIARRDGNEFVITGQKSAWVSNGTIAEAAALFCAVDMGDGRLGGGVFVVPLNEPGVTRGKPTDKIGQRALNQGEIFFDALKVPADYLVVPPEGYRAAADRILCLANGGMGTTFVGCARAAFELATDYAKTRVQGGVAIFQHQSMKSRLFKMYQKVEAARALNHRVTRINAARETPLLELAIASKVTSTQTAFEVASEALQVFGGAGISRDCPIEKIFRDARISMIEDGCNEVLGMVAAGEVLRPRKAARTMKMNAYVAGVGMTSFGRMMDDGLKSIAGDAIRAAIFDAGVDKREIEAAWMSNAAAGVLTGQECIRGEVVLRALGIGRLPVINVENACASASTAFNQACAMVSAGLYDVVLACGFEKMYFEDRAKVFGAFMGAVDVEQLQTILAGLEKSAAASGASEAASGAGKNRSMFMDIYAAAARGHMARYGTTARAVRHGLGQELLPRLAQSARPVPRGAQRRRGAGLADDRRAADPADVLADRRRRRGGDHRQRAQAAPARVGRRRARGFQRPALRVGSRRRRRKPFRPLRARGVRGSGTWAPRPKPRGTARRFGAGRADGL